MSTDRHDDPRVVYIAATRLSLLFRRDAWSSRRGGARCASTESRTNGPAEKGGAQVTEAAFEIALNCRGCSVGPRVFSQFSSNLRPDGLVCLAVAGFSFDTQRIRARGIRLPARRHSSSSNDCRMVVGGGRHRRSDAAFVRAERGAPATPIRAYSSIGQSPRLITGLFLVRVQVGLPFLSGARSTKFT